MIGQLGEEYWFVAVSYVFMAIVALWLWQFFTRAIPSPFGGLLWITAFALLFAPSLTEGQGAHVAPAVVGMLFGFLNKNQEQVLSNLLPILLTLAVGCLIGFIYEAFRRKPRAALGAAVHAAVLTDGQPVDDKPVSWR